MAWSTFSVSAEGKHLLPYPHKIEAQKQKVPQVGNFHSRPIFFVQKSTI